MAASRTDKKIDTVVFDIGHVLVDFDQRYLYRKIFSDEAEVEEFISSVATWDWHLEQDRGRTTAEGTDWLIGQHPEYREEIEAYYTRWDEMFGGSIQGTVEILEELEERGYTLFALTNWSDEMFGHAREKFPFLGKFREIVVSGEVGLLKPDPAIYEILIDRTGLDPETSVFIDDSPPNVKTASELGFNAIRFTAPEQLRRDLARLGMVSETGAEAGRR